MKINGDLIPSSSGIAHLGINGNGAGAFDITTLRPFGNVHLVSGVYHDPLAGQSGVMRYSKAAGAFQVSVDGGASFSNLSTAGGVTSIGVLGDADLTGAVDLAVANSGFMTIQDTANASPLLFAVDTLALSGLYRFPAQGFNSSVVNKLTDSNGTTAQGAISVVGSSGIIVDIVGQTLTIATNADTSNVVNSIGVVGDANLKGDIDLAVPASGFMTIQDTGDASPLLFSVNTIGLSGLYGFPTQGFNGKIVNEIADQSGDKANGSLTINGAGDITTNFAGNTLTISTTGPRGYTTTFTNTDSTVITHNLNSNNLIVDVWDNSAAPQQLIPDLLEITSVNSVTLKFNQTQSGRIVIVAVY